MILFLQFTVTDTRNFSKHHAELLNKPLWPSPRPYKEFVRNTGRIMERVKGGQASWVGENYICEVRRGIKFPKLLLSNGVKVSNISKHLFASENYVLTKYEFVFNLKINNKNIIIDHNFMKSLINELLASSCIIKINSAERQIQISQPPKVLIDFHYRNTTKISISKDQGAFSNLMQCTPQFYFYLDNNESVKELKRNYKHISNIFNIAELYGAWHDHKNNPFRIWIHHRLSKSQKVIQNRELRMTIMRLHSEYECLKNIFNAISSKLLSPQDRSRESEELQRYFNVAIKRYLLQEENLEYQSWTIGFFHYFSKIFAKSAPGELERIKEQIEHFRPNIKKKAINFYQKIKFVSNKYENNQSTILSQGDGNIVQNNQVTQNVNNDLPINYSQLLNEIIAVLEEARRVAKSTDDFKSIAALSEVKDAAEQKDSNKLINSLKATGKFIADIANKMTASIMVELLKNHTTLLS